MSNYTLNLDSKNTISLALEWGCNMYSWVCDGAEMMYCPPDYPAAAWKITGGGTPLLFPSVGRTYDMSGPEPVLGRYSIYGDDECYDMITHGFLFVCGWEVIEESKTDTSATVTLKAIIPKDIYTNRYPFDVSFFQTFTLSAGKVELTSKMVNNSDKPAPAAFGYHPYFRVSNPKRDGISVNLPVTRRLFINELTQLNGKSEPSDGQMDLQPDIYYDHAFDGITARRMTLTDIIAGRKMHVDFDEKFELLFLYSPDKSDFVCIEPWSRGMGAYADLCKQGWENGKEIPVIKANEQLTYKASFVVEKI